MGTSGRAYAITAFRERFGTSHPKAYGYGPLCLSFFFLLGINSEALIMDAHKDLPTIYNI